MKCNPRLLPPTSSTNVNQIPSKNGQRCRWPRFFLKYFGNRRNFSENLMLTRLSPDSITGCALLADDELAVGSRTLIATSQKSKANNQSKMQIEKMKKNKISKMIYSAAIILAVVIGHIAMADTQSDPFMPQSGGTGSGCPGIFTGMAKMTNNTGTFWITPPANTTNGILTDGSGFGSPYTSVACVKNKSTGASWCDTNSVTFPVTSNTQYSLTIYVKSPLPPPTNGQPVFIQVTWK